MDLVLKMRELNDWTNPDVLNRQPEQCDTGLNKE